MLRESGDSLSVAVLRARLMRAKTMKDRYADVAQLA